jgi:hypothetical protein
VRICSVPGCGGRHDSHGFCGAHAARWRHHGDPLGGRTAKGAALRFFQNVVITWTDETDCLFWPYARFGNGYAELKQTLAHRLVCEHVHGPAPTLEHEAAHECGKGHLGCVNPRHLSWKTHKENEADKNGHGTRLCGERAANTTLKNADISQIRALAGSMSQQKIGEMFGVAHPRRRPLRRYCDLC